jgi:hypothetical protein
MTLGKPMVTVAVQFLEDSPELREIAPSKVRKRLREAFGRLQISALLLGWIIPKTLFEAVVEETTQADVRLYRWHPLLAMALFSLSPNGKQLV